jgi:broad specificity phosphatase PhoE
VSESAGPASWTGVKGTPTRLVLLRHGQTQLSAQRRYSGRGNPRLTETGQRQAAAAAERLGSPAGFGDIAAVVCSPLDRTMQTGRAVGATTGAPVTALNELIETDFGAWEGLTFGEAVERDPELHKTWLADPTVSTPGGESFDQVHERVDRAKDRIVAEFGGATVVVVSHVTPIKTLLRIGLDTGPSLLFRLHLDLASLSVVEFYPDGNTSVRLVNDTAHLS